jgi:DNA-binding PadR family transcriptional regulator
MKHDATQFLPLSHASLHILLALAGGDLHGYGIMQEIARQSASQFKLGPGTLYDNLKKLMQLGLIEETSSRSSTDDPRRRYYHLKGLGRNVLALEVERLEEVLREARSHLRAVKPLKPRRT